ncbi:MAG: hypothetical protein GY856_50390 [bacterium]|nr:hypothetical protein [bacterium]
MKALIKILLWGFVAFLAIAMIEEREVFLTVFVAPEARSGESETEPAPPPELSEAERRGVEDGLRQFLTLMRHLYASGGDPRFAERLPAAAKVVEEIMTDVVYLQHNQRRQELSLMNLEILDLELRQDRARVRTEELWIIRTFWGPHRQPADPPRSAKFHVEYFLTREARGWHVEGWDLTRGIGDTDEIASGDLKIPNQETKSGPVAAGPPAGW